MPNKIDVLPTVKEVYFSTCNDSSTVSDNDSIGDGKDDDNYEKSDSESESSQEEDASEEGNNNLVHDVLRLRGSNIKRPKNHRRTSGEKSNSKRKRSKFSHDFLNRKKYIYGFARLVLVSTIYFVLCVTRLKVAEKTGKSAVTRHNTR